MPAQMVAGAAGARDRLWHLPHRLDPAGILGLSLGRTLRIFVRTLYQMRFSLIAILAMLGLGFLTRYSGMDAVMRLAMTNTGWLYPLFGTLIGWLGVAVATVITRRPSVVWLKTVSKVQGTDAKRVIRLSESRFPELM